MKAIRFLIIHHSATKRSTTVEAIRRAHKRRGFRDIGYSHIIDGGAQLHPGRGLRQTLAANPPRNFDAVALLVMGDNTRAGEQWTEEQHIEIARYVGAVVYLHPDIIIGAHHVLGSTPTLCPGIDLRVMESLRPWRRLIVGPGEITVDPAGVRRPGRRQGSRSRP